MVGLYASIGVHVAHGAEALRQVPTRLDDWVGFSAPWVLVYAGVYTQAIAPLSVITDRRVLERTLAAYVTLVLLAVPFWLLFPVTVPRSPVPIVDVWTYGVGLVRLIDPPTNCMPSMHVGTAVIAALVVRRHDRVAGALLATSATAIWWSTLAIDQHWALDGLVGAGLAILADRVWLGLRPLPADAYAPLPRAWHLVWLGAYVALVVVLMSGWFLGWVPVERLPPNAPAW